MNDQQESGNKADEYTGPDQRRTTRRETVDRREEIRFDLDNADRRKGRGRRKEDKLFWD